jgi:hypothetical protein
MLELFERVSDDIPNVTKICGCTNYADHFRIRFSDYILCTDKKSICSKSIICGYQQPYIKCMSTNRLLIVNNSGYHATKSIHSKCNIVIINDAYKQLVYKETKELYNKIRLVYRDIEFQDIIRYTITILLSHGFRYLK